MKTLKNFRCRKVEEVGGKKVWSRSLDKELNPNVPKTSSAPQQLWEPALPSFPKLVGRESLRLLDSFPTLPYPFSEAPGLGHGAGTKERPSTLGCGFTTPSPSWSQHVWCCKETIALTSGCIGAAR